MSDFLKDDISTFLSFLSGDKDLNSERFSFCLMDESSIAPIPGYGLLYNTLEELQSNINLLIAVSKSPTVHVTLNRTDGFGRKTKNIIEPRVLCVDFDTPLFKSTLIEFLENYKPHLIVESSPQKYHLYWKISPNISLESWSKYQLAIAQFFDADKELRQVAKTIRVPGIWRICKDGTHFRPEIKYLSGEICELTEVEIGALFPWIQEQWELAAVEMKKERKVLIEAAKTNYSSKDFKTLASKGRNATLYACLRRDLSAVAYSQEGSLVEVTQESANALGIAINSKFDEPLGEVEVTNIVKKVYPKAIASREWKLKKLKESGAKIVEQLSVEQVESVSQVEVSLNGHAGNESGIDVESPYPYNYNDPDLHDNRFTDEAINARVIQRFGDRLLKVGKNTHVFNEVSKVWQIEDTKSHPQISSFVRQCIKDTRRDSKFIPELCTADNGEVSASKLRRMQEKFHSGKMIETICRLLMHDTRVRETNSDIFDTNPQLFYCLNGVVDMINGSLRDATALDYLIGRSPVRYEPGEKCPWWEQFLVEVFEESDEPGKMVSFIQEIFGYSISGEILEQKIFCHYGHGSNGKSKVLQALHMLGGSYSTYIDPDELVRKNAFSSKTFEKFGSKVEGKHIAIIDDMEVKAVWNEAFVKNLTSPNLRARAEYETSRVVKNRAKIHCGLNQTPAPESENYGILRRLCLIPYIRTFDPDNEVSTLIDKQIESEASGILNWAIEGYKRFKRNGKIQYPNAIAEASEEYRQEFFGVEVGIEELFEKPSNESDGTWEFLFDLHQDISNHVGGKIDLSETSLGITLKRKLKLESKKIWNKDRKNASKAYFIKLKFERKDLKSFL